MQSITRGKNPWWNKAGEKAAKGEKKPKKKKKEVDKSGTGFGAISAHLN